VFWTLHITYTDIATDLVDSLHMLAVQFAVVALLSGVLALFIEPQVTYPLRVCQRSNLNTL